MTAASASARPKTRPALAARTAEKRAVERAAVKRGSASVCVPRALEWEAAKELELATRALSVSRRANGKPNNQSGVARSAACSTRAAVSAAPCGQGSAGETARSQRREPAAHRNARARKNARAATGCDRTRWNGRDRPRNAARREPPNARNGASRMHHSRLECHRAARAAAHTSAHAAAHCPAAPPASGGARRAPELARAPLEYDVKASGRWSRCLAQSNLGGGGGGGGEAKQGERPKGSRARRARSIDRSRSIGRRGQESGREHATAAKGKRAAAKPSRQPLNARAEEHAPSPTARRTIACARGQHQRQRLRARAEGLKSHQEAVGDAVGRHCATRTRSSESGALERSRRKCAAQRVRVGAHEGKRAQP